MELPRVEIELDQFLLRDEEASEESSNRDLEFEKETSFINPEGDEMEQYNGVGPLTLRAIEGDETSEHLELRKKVLTKVKSIIFYRIFKESFDPEFGDKMSELFRKMDLITDENNEVLEIRFEGSVVGWHSDGEGYTISDEDPSRDSAVSRFRRLASEAQSEFEETDLGKYRIWLEDQGIEDTTPGDLKRLFAFERRNFSENDLTRLERFKQFARRNLFFLSGLAIVIASAITAVILTARQGLRRASKSVRKGDKKGGGSSGDKGEVLDGDDLTPSGQTPRDAISGFLSWLSDNLIFVTFLIVLTLLLLRER